MQKFASIWWWSDGDGDDSDGDDSDSDDSDGDDSDDSDDRNGDDSEGDDSDGDDSDGDDIEVKDLDPDWIIVWKVNNEEWVFESPNCQTVEQFLLIGCISWF